MPANLLSECRAIDINGTSTCGPKIGRRARAELIRAVPPSRIHPRGCANKWPQVRGIFDRSVLEFRRMNMPPTSSCGVVFS
jgi:hypothetical protein